MPRWILSILAVPALVTFLHAGAPADRSQAEALVQEAVTFGKANSRENLIREINGEQGRLHTTTPGVVYLVVYDIKGKVAAHGLDAKHLRMDHLNYPELKAMADKNAKGWHEYSVPNPKAGKPSTFGVAYALLKDDLITSTVSIP